MKRILPISMLIVGAMLVASQAGATTDGEATLMSAAQLQSVVGACGTCVIHQQDLGCMDCVKDSYDTSHTCVVDPNENRLGRKCVSGSPDDCRMNDTLTCSNTYYIWEEDGSCAGDYDYTWDAPCVVDEATGSTCH